MVTMKDIALKAGVSIGTVDRVLHKRGRFSEETAAKVRAVVEELGYEPNVMARNLSVSKQCRIAVLIPYPEQDSGYWALPLQGMKRAFENVKIYGVKMDIFHFDRYKPESFGEAAAEITKEIYDGYLAAPLIEDSTRKLITQLPPGAPVLFFDTDLEDSSRTAYIGQDSLLSGKLAAKLMKMLAGDCRGGEFLVISPDTHNIHLDDRIEGFREKVPCRIRVMRTVIEAEKKRELFYNKLESSINSETIGIFVVDASAHYAADYFVEKGIKLPLIGFDLVEENAKRVSDGTIDFILTQRPSEQGYKGIRLLYRMLMLDDKLSEDIIMPIDIITAENINRQQ
jgi:LacI family transcriptional regulator